MALAPLSQDKAHIPKNISFDLRLQAVDAWSSSAAPALLREPVWKPFPLFSLFSDSERGNWLAWLRRVGDWQPLTSNHSDNERGGKQRDVASDATSVCLCYRGGTVHVWPHVHVLCAFTHACIVQGCRFPIISQCEIVFASYVYFCQETPLHYSLRDPKATQRSHSALPYICGRLAQLVLRTPCMLRDTAHSDLPERWNWLPTPCPWDDSGDRFIK